MTTSLAKAIQKAIGRPQTGTLDTGDFMEIHRKLTGVRYVEPEPPKDGAEELATVAKVATITNHGQ